MPEKPEKDELKEKWAEAVRLLAPAAKAGRERATELQKEYAKQLGWDRLVTGRAMSGGLCMCRNGCVCDTQEKWIEVYENRAMALQLEQQRLLARIEMLESSLGERRNALRQIARMLRDGAWRYRRRRKTMLWLVDELFVEAARADHDLSSDVQPLQVVASRR